MGNVLNFMAAVFLLLLLFAAQLFPGSPLFWVASMATAFTVLRYALVLLLLCTLIRPPRTKWIRVPLGTFALGLAGWLIDTTYAGSLGIIDFLAFATATTALLTTLLESKPKEEEFKSMRLASAVSNWAWDKTILAYYWTVQLSWLTLTDINLSLGEYLQRINNHGGRPYSYGRSARYAPRGRTFAR